MEWPKISIGKTWNENNFQNLESEERVRKDTRTHLVEELLKKPQSALRDQIIAEAKAGEFHDYKNNKYTCGKVAAAHLLTAAGFEDLALKIKDGEYDERADEEDRANMRKFAPKEMWSLLGLDEQ